MGDAAKAIHDYLEKLTPHVVRGRCPYCLNGRVLRGGNPTNEKCAVCAGTGQLVTEEPKERNG